ncbi:penicillin-binding protein [Pseudoxanthomonas kalamensis DSM 18571]|uniref:serine hydrolase n=1 Tax=Pseudoxanthomonas kalamensis TaxID=289483 RepID=UPI0013914789|nr:serine hydrolase [Pseudoxanthomonas kalamensis]KAF1712604.1 penicillin-binding protein [Pseudoxanthomonas kalamensis DSM 18571]
MAVFACLLLCGSGQVLARDNGERAIFDAAFDDTFNRYHLPGLAVGIVEDGKVVYTRAAGELEAGKGESITTETLFKIASNSKAMTTGLLARLVDQGKLAWSDPVSKYLPEFRMHDDWVTQNIQVRDLLIHNSGLGPGAGDLMLWPEPNHFTRADIINGLGWLKPTHSFRAHYTYDNLMYVVAGEVAAAAGGKPYDQLLREQLFQPLGMQRCQVGEWNRIEVGNVAQPHMRIGDGNQVIRRDGDLVPDATGMAAGGIRCSLDDMLTWVRMWLDPQSQWVSATQRRTLWSVQMPMPVSQRMRNWDNTHFNGYGYGWRLSDVDGVWRVAHTGTLAGMYSSVTLLPDQRTGIVVLINGSGGEARTVLTQALTKHFTAPEQRATVAGYAEALAGERGKTGRSSVQVPDTSARASLPPAQAKDALGRYVDPWFGTISLCTVDDRVVFASDKSPLMRGEVMQVGGRWLIDWFDDSVDAEAWLEFHPRTADTGGRLSLSHVDPDADSSFDFPDLDFSRVADCP